MKYWLAAGSRCLVLLTCASAAQPAEPEPLSAMVRQAADQFTPPTAAQVADARSNAQRNADSLATWMRAGGDNGRAWRRYVLLDDIEAQLRAATPDVAVLHAAVKRLSADHDGLELLQFTQLRDALWRYAGLLEAALPAARQNYADRIADLADALATLEGGASEVDSPELLARIGADTGWLQQHAQTPQLVAAIRRRYAQPNLLLTVSQRVLDGFVEPFKDNSPFEETILNTPTYGRSDMQGEVRLAFAPHDHGAAIQLNLKAAGTADTVSVSGPVSVHSLAQVTMSAHKQLLLTPDGAVIQPAVAQAKSESQTKGISTSLRGVARRIACRLASQRADACRVAGQREGDRKAEFRLQRRFDRQAGKPLQKLANLYLDEIRGPLVSRRQFPHQVDLQTTSDRMRLALVQADFDQLAAASPPPALDGPSDIGVRVHESAMNNLAQKLLGGREIGVEQLMARVERIVNATGESETESPPPDESSDEIQITLDEQQPITVRFDDSIAALVIRGTKFVARGKAYPAMHVTIRYRVELTPGGSHFTLIDGPEVIPARLAGVEGGRLSFSELAVRRLLVNRLERDLEKELGAPDVDLPGDLLDLDPLPIEQLSVDDGWLVFSCRVAEPPPSK